MVSWTVSDPVRTVALTIDERKRAAPDPLGERLTIAYHAPSSVELLLDTQLLLWAGSARTQAHRVSRHGAR